MKRLERFTELVDDAISAKGLDPVDAQRAKSALIQFAYITALSTFAYQLGEEDRGAIRNILEQQGIEPPTPSASHYKSLEETHETTRGGAEESVTELKNLIGLFCSRALEHQAGDSVATRLQSAMRAHLLQAHERAVDSISIKYQAKEVAHFIDTATRESVISPADPSLIESAGFTMATMYRELAIATVHSMITVHLEGRKHDLVSRLNTIRETFDPRPPARLNAGEASQSANRRGKEGYRPPTLGEQIRSECAAVGELFPVYLDEAVEMAGWIIDELCPVLEQGTAVGIAEPWKEELRTSFEQLVKAIEAENIPRSDSN